MHSTFESGVQSAWLNGSVDYTCKWIIHGLYNRKIKLNASFGMKDTSIQRTAEYYIVCQRNKLFICKCIFVCYQHYTAAKDSALTRSN